MKITKSELERQKLSEYRAGLVYGILAGGILGATLYSIAKQKENTRYSEMEKLRKQIHVVEKKVGIPSTVVKVTTTTWPEYVREQERQHAQRLAEDLREAGLVIKEK